MRVLCAVLCSAGLLVAMATAGSASAQSPGTTRVVRPKLDQVVGNGKVRVVVRTRTRARVEIDGRSVNRYLRRTARGYRGVVRLGQGLRYGSNELTVATRGHADFDRVGFIVAKRSTTLVAMRALRVRGREAPARVVVTPGPRSTLRAWLNGRRVEHAFQPRGRRFVGRLGANDGVRPGRNRLVVLTHRTARHGRHAVYDVERETFWHKRGRVIAGAGRDRVFSSGELHHAPRQRGGRRGRRGPPVADRDRAARCAGAAARGADRAARAGRDDPGDLPDPHAGGGSQRLVLRRHGHHRRPSAGAAARVGAPDGRRPRHDHAERRGDRTTRRGRARAAATRAARRTCRGR